jgi:hypothetical protein
MLFRSVVYKSSSSLWKSRSVLSTNRSMSMIDLWLYALDIILLLTACLASSASGDRSNEGAGMSLNSETYLQIKYPKNNITATNGTQNTDRLELWEPTS